MSAKSFNSFRIIIAVIFAALVGLAIYFDTDLNELITLAIAIIVFGLMLLIIPRHKEPGEVFVAPGVTAADRDEILNQGKDQLKAYKKALAHLPENDPASKPIHSIGDTLEILYKNLEEDPADIPSCNAFLKFHSPQAVSLVDNYSRLVSSPLPDDRQAKQIEAARERFTSIEKAFRAQYNAVKSNDISALEQASRNLETSLRIEHGLESMTKLSKPENQDNPS